MKIPLETRVGVGSGVMIVDYTKLWQIIYEELRLKMDLTLMKLLRSCNIKNTNKSLVQRMTSGKEEAKQ